MASLSLINMYWTMKWIGLLLFGAIALSMSAQCSAQEISLVAVDSVVKLEGGAELIYASVKNLPNDRDAMFTMSESVQRDMPVKKVRYSEGKEQIWIVALKRDIDVKKVIELMNVGYAEYRKKQSEMK